MQTWYRIDRWSVTPDKFDVAKVTDKTLFFVSGSQFFPTEAQAFEAIDARKAREAAKVADKRIRDAAPDLLEALERLKPVLDRAESNASGNMEWDDVSARVNAARSAIAKARGGAA